MARPRLVDVAPVAVPVVFVEVAVYLLLFVVSMDFVPVADSTADWLAASAAGDGVDPYSDMRSLAAEYEVTYSSPAANLISDAEWVHPRLVGALFALQPLTLLSAETVFLLVSVCSLVSLAFVSIRLFPQPSGWPWVRSLAVASGFAFTAPFIRTLQFGSWGMAFAVIIWWFWKKVRDGEGILAGIALGLIGAFKIYPLIMLIPAMLGRRWRTVATTVAAFSLSNLIGAALFDVGLKETVEALQRAGEVWLNLPSNASLVPWLVRVLGLQPVTAALLASTALGLGIWLVWRATQDIDLVTALTVVVMLLATPLSWISNDVMLLLPVAIGVGSVKSWKGRAILVGWFLLTLLPAYHIPNSGTISLLGRLLLGALFLGFALSYHRSERTPPTAHAVHA